MTVAKVKEYRKAVVALVGAIVGLAGVAGFHIDPSAVYSVVGSLTALAVAYVKNAPKF